MPYATGRTYLDANSHIMERPDFNRDFAEAKVRDQSASINGGNQGKTSTSWGKVVEQPGCKRETFEGFMTDCSIQTKDKFYSDNFS